MEFVTSVPRANPRATLGRSVVLGASFAVFGLLLGGLPPEGPHPLDAALMDAVVSVRTDVATLLFTGVTRLGDGWVVVLATVGGVALLALRSRLWAGFFGIAVAGAAALNQALKHLIGRVRPENPEPLAMAHGYAFPSGHAMATTAFALGLFFVVRALSPRHQWTAGAVGVVFVGFVGASRVYLGVHYPTDVLAGWALATGWVVLLATVAAQWTRRRTALTAPAEPDR